MSNYTLTIKSVLPGTDGSTVGHARITISDGVTSTSYGYYPKEGFDGPLDLLWGDPGEVKNNHDDSVYKNPDYSKEIPISKHQYERAIDVAESIKSNPPGYDLLGLAGGNCSSFVQEVTNGSGVTDIPDFLEQPFPSFLPKSKWFDESFLEKMLDFGK